MSIVNSINRVYGVNNTRAVGKISFNVGERFNGRVIKKIEPASAVIRLGDGIDFAVDVEGDLELLKEGLAKFEVTGFKDGKLQLKVVADNGSSSSNKLQGQLGGNLLSNLDTEVMEGLLKFNIPLTKENIKDVKSLIQFIDKANTNPEEIDAFVQKYLETNNINDESGKLTNSLKSFLNEFKSLTADDVLFFMENNLDFDEETIKAFNKLVKNENNELLKNLDNLKSDIGNIQSKNDENGNKVINDNLSNLKGQADINEVESESNINTLIAKSVYEKNETSQKLDIVSILKSISNKTEANSENNSNIDVKQAIDTMLNDKNIDTIKNDSVVNILKSIVTVVEAKGDIPNKQLEKIISENLGKEVSLSQEDTEKIKLILNDKSLVDKIKTLIKDDLRKEESLLIQKDIKEQIKSKGEETKELIRAIIDNDTTESNQSDKFASFIKENISNIKLMNKINNEYYYFDSNIKILNNEYPCKLIIKDNRKDGKQIDSTNVKMVVSIKTINIGEVDAFINVVDKSMNIQFKCEEDHVKILKTIQIGLSEILMQTGYIPNISVEKKEEPVNIINCRGFFNQNNRTNLDIKV